MSVLSSQEIIGIAKQTSFGTIPSTPTTDYSLVPVAAGGFSASETFENIMDTGRRGSNAIKFAVTITKERCHPSLGFSRYQCAAYTEPIATGNLSACNVDATAYVGP